MSSPRCRENKSLRLKVFQEWSPLPPHGGINKNMLNECRSGDRRKEADWVATRRMVFPPYRAGL